MIIYFCSDIRKNVYPKFYLQENKTTKLTHGFGIYDLMNEHCVKIDITYTFLIHNNKSVWCVYTYFFKILFQLKISFWKNCIIISTQFYLFFFFFYSFILHMLHVQSSFDYEWGLTHRSIYVCVCFSIHFFALRPYVANSVKFIHGKVGH